MNTKDIQMLVGKNRVLASHKWVCENVNFILPSREMDVMSIGPKGLLYEYEVKVSRSDFLADKRKQKAMYNGENGLFLDYHNPNYFFYVCPDGLIKPHEIPSFAGLYYAINNDIVLQKKAIQLSSYKHDLLKIQEKFMNLYQERHFLGFAKMTYLNKEIKRKNKERLDRYKSCSSE